MDVDSVTAKSLIHMPGIYWDMVGGRIGPITVVARAEMVPCSGYGRPLGSTWVPPTSISVA